MRFITLLLTGFFALVCTAEAEEKSVRWQGAELGGNKIGYRQLSRETQGDRVISTETLVITLQQPGESSRTSTITLRYEDDLNGKPLSLHKTVRSQAVNQTLTAKVSGDVLQVHRSDGSRTESSHIAIPENFLLPEGVRRALSEKNGERRQLTYSLFNFSTLAFETVRLEGEQGVGQFAWVFSYRQGKDAKPTQWFTNEAFEVVREESVTGGEILVLYDCSEDCALAPFSPTTHVYRQLLRAPVRIPAAALRGHIRYQLVGETTLMPPVTAEQQVQKSERGWQLDVCSSCGDDASPTEEILTQAKQANYWIAADDPEIKRLAAEHGAAEDMTEAMAQLTRFVGLHMKAQPDYAGFATAREALASGTGDCTEHALLLAALARAAGFPARIAIGLAYNTERFLGRKYVFVPHAWVQVWDGNAWRSYDSGLGEFHAGYLTLALSYSGEVSHFTRVNAQLHALQIVSAALVQSNTDRSKASNEATAP
ncbi:hypothetical protein FHR99_001794 [Litorivivens lipolytica]|uniref:Transglutaminase-like domain-containing protein n=1 Tax=Litorivivens lipolytica TaxID=1524264 RepID=A0A7W4W4Y9_9GAMM|nr:transglutaminase-like domain-containing protein [Litorivivens lipolytica]MBB3047528.1 hypothetical protein [Litorivivens lipolytica]